MDTNSGCKMVDPVAKANPYSNPKITLGEHYDIMITQARERVEELCVKKAKLEALQLLNHPYHQMRQLMDSYFS